MKIGKVIVEINGVNHKLIHSRAKKPCKTCSAKKHCECFPNNVIADMCFKLRGFDGKFILQKWKINTNQDKL